MDNLDFIEDGGFTCNLKQYFVLTIALSQFRENERSVWYKHFKLQLLKS